MEDRIAINRVDVRKRKIEKAYLIRTGEGCRLREAEGEFPETDLYISPGWIDMHTHVYDGFTSLGVDADRVGIKTGVHVVADAGSAGEATLPGLIRYVLPAHRTEIREWLNISSVGLVTMREYNDMSLLKVEDTVKAALENAPTVIGIKARSSGIIVGDKGIKPLEIAVKAARQAHLPLMVHIGEKPPDIREILRLLDRGDIITHCFHGKEGTPWLPDGTPIPELRSAWERGVRMDVGHGAASFSFDIFKRAVSHPLPPFSISTDMHIRNVNGPVFSLAVTMTKLMSCGLPLIDTIMGVTQIPAQTLGMTDRMDLDGPIRSATIFRVADSRPDTPPLRDSMRNAIIPQKLILPTGVIYDGRYQTLD